ncbi:hypothetical protein GWI33_023405 [Rhynchophorus ferrugineus]|uniref:Uncharacterized protein n=1 Tax=Rhynchophorus ferrugineus TaxID=354439 RepID=A0A834MKI7_RHYFE|nr:hypothetical protein GWI33_023405 [Rhynchophorus ferrugineus]
MPRRLAAPLGNYGKVSATPFDSRPVAADRYACNRIVRAPSGDACALSVGEGGRGELSNAWRYYLDVEQKFQMGGSQLFHQLLDNTYLIGGAVIVMSDLLSMHYHKFTHSVDSVYNVTGEEAALNIARLRVTYGCPIG